MKNGNKTLWKNDEEKTEALMNCLRNILSQMAAINVLSPMILSGKRET